MENSIVEDWLRSLQLFQYSQSFIDNGYDDLEICKKIDEPDLDAIGVVNAVHRDKILNAVKILLEQGGTAVYFTLEETSRVSSASDQPNSPASSIATTASVSSTETRRTSDNSTTGDPLNCNSTKARRSPEGNRDFIPSGYGHEQQPEVQNVHLVKIPNLQLKMLLRDRLVAEGIRLSSSPYTNTDGSQGFLEGLASRYAEQLRTHYQDVLERLCELWSKMVVSELNRSLQVIDTKSYDATSGNSIYAPGIYSPSSCLSDHEEELIYGYSKFPSWFQSGEESSPKSLNTKSQNLYDSDGYYSIGFNSTNSDSPSMKKKSGIGKFLKVLSSKKDKSSPKYIKPQRSHSNSTPLVDRANNSFHDRSDLYSLNSATEEEKLKIMLLAGEGKIPVRTAVERVRKIESEQRNFAQQENLEVIPHFRKSLERSPGNGHYSEPRYYTDVSRGQRTSHFYDDPPYESEDSECPDVTEKSRRKHRHRKNRQDKIKQHRHSSSRGEVSREKSSISMNGSSRKNEQSPEEPQTYLAARNHPNVNKCLQSHTSCSNPSTPLHHNHTHDLNSRLSSSCQPSPIYSRSSYRNQDSKYSDYASSPVTPARQRVGMLNRIKQLTSRNSLSAEEEIGYSPSSEYEERDDIEAMKPENLSSSKDLSSRPNTIVGKMKVLRRDVKRKFSKLRSNCGSESEADGGASSMVICNASSVESVENESQESILNNTVLTTATTTASSSNRSSASVDDDSHAGWSGPIIAKAQALVDCIPSPYDHDALKFKKGKIIDVISMPQSGIWKGICDNHIGTFKFINVKVIEHEHRKPRKHHKKRYSRKSRPKSVEELLCRINLEQYISVFMLNGYENLELFQDIEDEDLDYLGIVEAEHRAKLITAAELLHDYSESPDRDRDVNDRINVQPEINHQASTIETSMSFDTVFKHRQSPHDSGCFASTENVNRKDSIQNLCNNAPAAKGEAELINSDGSVNASEGVDSLIISSMNNLDVAVSRSSENEHGPPNDLLNVNVGWTKIDSNDIQHSHICSSEFPNASSLSKGNCNSEFITVVPAPEMVESSSTSSKNVLSAEGTTSKCERKVPPPIPVRTCVVTHPNRSKFENSSDIHIKDNFTPSYELHNESIPPIDHQLWHEGESGLSAGRCSSQSRHRKNKGTSSFKGKKSLELNLSRKSTTSKSVCSQNNSTNSGNKYSNDICNQALMNQVVHKLNAEGINLSALPYTDKSGFCGIPPALVQRYTEELDQDISLMAKILDRIRIIHLKMQGKVGVPNDFLIDSCTSPATSASYASVNSWLISLGLPMYYEGFHQMGYVDLEQCSKMTEQELNLCRVQDARHLLKVLRAIDSLQFHLQQS